MASPLQPRVRSTILTALLALLVAFGSAQAQMCDLSCNMLTGSAHCLAQSSQRSMPACHHGAHAALPMASACLQVSSSMVCHQPLTLAGNTDASADLAAPALTVSPLGNKPLADLLPPSNLAVKETPPGRTIPILSLTQILRV